MADKKMSYKNLIKEHKEIVKDLEGSKKQHDLQKKELERLYSEYKKIKKYSEGGEVEKSSKEQKIEDSVKESTEGLKKAKKSHKDLMESMEEDIPEPDQYANGGEVTPAEEFFDPETNTQNVDFTEGSTIIGNGPSIPQEEPASLLDVEEKNSEDKALEERYANEDFEAKENTPDEETPEEDQTEKEISEESATSQPMDEDKQSFSRLLASLKPQKTANEDLKEAQRQRDINIGMQQLQRGAALAGSGISKTDPSQLLKIIDEQDKYANLPVQKYNELIQDQQNDPQSSMSMVMKQYLQNKGFKVPDGTSAADLFKIAPFLAKDEALKNALQKTLLTQQIKVSEGALNRKSREDIAKTNQSLRADQLAAYKERTKAQIGSTNDRKMQTRLDNLNKDLAQGGGTVVNQNRISMQRANNLFLTNGIDPKINEKDIDKIPNSQLNKVNKISVVETAIELNRLLTGSGVPAQGTLNKLIPNNLNMSATQIMDYITSKLNPAKQAEALKSYMKIAARVRDQSNNNVSNYLKQRLSGSKQILDYFPEQARAMKEEARSQGFDVGELEKASASEPSEKDKKALDIYNKMKDTDPQKPVLEKILRNKGLLQ